MEQASWQQFADWMKANGMINKSVNANAVMTNSYLPAG
jgi:putative hydroxymethylpyrimidine transport system substrate-binding protein